MLNEDRRNRSDRMDASLYGINPDVIGYLNHTDGNLHVAHPIGRMIYSEL